MKKKLRIKKQVIGVIVGYIIVALICLLGMHRIEMLESIEDIEACNQKVTMNVQ